MACDADTLITLAYSTNKFGQLSKRDLMLCLAAVYAVGNQGWTADTAIVQAISNGYQKFSWKDLWQAFLAAICAGPAVTPAPTGAQWSAFQFGAGTMETTVLEPSPPCPSWNIRHRVQPSLIWTTETAQATALDFTFGCSPGQVIEIQAQWVGCAAGDSDWSATQTVTAT